MKNLIAQIKSLVDEVLVKEEIMKLLLNLEEGGNEDNDKNANRSNIYLIDLESWCLENKIGGNVIYVLEDSNNKIKIQE